eukprot:4605528-Prymnesium_polylepis.1
MRRSETEMSLDVGPLVARLPVEVARRLPEGCQVARLPGCQVARLLGCQLLPAVASCCQLLPA